jgi:hypothetical protein
VAAGPTGYTGSADERGRELLQTAVNAPRHLLLLQIDVNHVAYTSQNYTGKTILKTRLRRSLDGVVFVAVDVSTLIHS